MSCLGKVKLRQRSLLAPSKLSLFPPGETTTSARQCAPGRNVRYLSSACPPVDSGWHIELKSSLGRETRFTKKVPSSSRVSSSVSGSVSLSVGHWSVWVASGCRADAFFVLVLSILVVLEVVFVVPEGDVDAPSTEDSSIGEA